jgi:DNA mismatch repair ATPase MutS
VRAALDEHVSTCTRPGAAAIELCAQVAAVAGGVVCIRDMRHPCVAHLVDGEFIPNNIALGVRDGNDSDAAARVMLLTGPNMGGKSTIMRQV